MKKGAKYVLFVALATLILFFVVEHVFLVSIAKTAINYLIKLDTHMNRVIINPFLGSVTIRGFKIYNPQGFKEKILATAPLVNIDFSPKTIFKRGAYFDEIIVHIKEINVIKQKDGMTNIGKMHAFTPKEEPNEKEPFLADRYVVEIEKIKFTDYTKEEPVTEEIELNIREEYKKVKNPDNIVNAIGFKLYFNAGLKNIGVNVKKLRQELAKLAEKNKKLKDEFAKYAEEQAEKAKEAVKEKLEETKEAIGGKIEATKEGVEKVQEAVKEKVEEIKEEIEEHSKK